MKQNKLESNTTRVPLTPPALLPVKDPETKEELLEAIQVYNDSLNHHAENQAFHYEQMEKYKQALDELKPKREMLFVKLRRVLGEATAQLK